MQADLGAAVQPVDLPASTRRVSSSYLSGNGSRPTPGHGDRPIQPLPTTDCRQFSVASHHDPSPVVASEDREARALAPEPQGKHCESLSLLPSITQIVQGNAVLPVEAPAAALLEAQWIMEEIKRMGISGFDALAYILVVKLGSLNAAFDFMDSSHENYFPYINFDTGIMLLYLDVPKLTGLSLAKCFASMMEHAGVATRESWHRCFVNNVSSDFLTNLSNSYAAPCDADAATRQTSAEGNVRGAGADAAARVGAAATTAEAAAAIGDDAAVAADPVAKLAAASAASEAGSTASNSAKITYNAGTAATTAPNSAKISASAVTSATTVPNSIKISTNTNTNTATTPNSVKISASAVPVASATASAAVITGAGPLELAEWEPSIPPHMLDFARQIYLQLASLKEGDSIEFPVSFTDEERHVVHLLSNQLSLFSRSEGIHEARCVTVFNARNTAERIRQELLRILPNESKLYPESTPKIDRRIITVIADELGFFTTLGPTIEVFNSADNATDVANIMAGLADGEEHLFPADFTEAQRRIGHTLVTDTNFSHATVNTKDGTHLCIGNKPTYKEQVRTELMLLQPGDEKTYPASLTPLERNIVQTVAEEVGCRSKLLGSMQGQHVHVTCVTREGTTADEPEEEGARFLKQTEVMLQKVFDHYTSKESLFRFANLKCFVEDVMPLHSGKFSKKVLSRLDDAYDDTLQLQHDMGFRAKAGLNRKFFHVFLEKCAATLTWTVVALLSALFDNMRSGESSAHS
eukprot:NODE_1130_length_2595_cov_4.469611.p1 GENE.NODE_1130_length_2595_cov_4.469611~~NODE_1130_length_2595_cov_4.469611.p1  ORF type:complete len:796 (+),score=152.72 NODE_1130_length_2595_cov_4.469611:128-2389(+)